MKKTFQGKIFTEVPSDWDCGGWLSAEVLRAAAGASNISFRCVVGQKYRCVEYDIKLNIFTFGKIKLDFPFTVIGPPFSIDKTGFEGDFKELAEDYSRRAGIFLALNLPRRPEGIAYAATLPSCVFDNVFSSFEEYMAALRGGYRRRNLIALKKGEALEIKKITNQDFSNDLLRLYLNVLNRSKYPLETLNVTFFQNFNGKIFVFYLKKTPVGFAALHNTDAELEFVFGGMDYEKRDEFDIYYNILLFILRYGIESGVKTINFGQTAESSKLRIGCRLSERYMAAFSGNALADWGLKNFGSALGYKAPLEKYRPFKN
jgi:hypothetical protein